MSLCISDSLKDTKVAIASRTQRLQRTQRQQTLRAAIDWSYDLLSNAERTLLRRLSVFAGGCTMEGAAEVAADHRLQQLEIFDLMASLIDNVSVGVA